MTVSRTCSDEGLAVELDLGAGEYLSYRIPEAEGTVEYGLADHLGTVLMDSGGCPPPCTRRWPRDDDEIPDDDEVDHVLGVQFIGDGRLVYRIEKRRAGEGADGAVEDGGEDRLLEVVKECTLAHSGAQDEHFEPVTVFLTGD